MDLAEFFTVTTLFSVFTLTLLETVLGIDNIIFLTILVNKLPKHQQPIGRRLGLILALGTRILLLMTLSWLTGLTSVLFTVAGHGVTGKDLVLLIGGGFLIFKSTWEIFGGLESEDVREEETHKDDTGHSRNFILTVIQIAIMDIVFSLDSVITAVGLARQLPVILCAMTLSMIAMLGFAGFIGDFVSKHPSMKVLALSFLIMIGTMLVAEGGGQHIPKGYIYASMAFSVSVELLNLWLRRRSEKVHKLHDLTRHATAAEQGELAPDSVPNMNAQMMARVMELEQLVEKQKKQIEQLGGSPG